MHANQIQCKHGLTVLIRARKFLDAVTEGTFKHETTFCRKHVME